MSEEVVLQGEDAVLAPEAGSQWITVGLVSVHVIRTDEGVVVDLYPLGCEAEPSCGSTFMFEEEARNAIRSAMEEGTYAGSAVL